jgi:glycine cleavage system H protein
VNEMNDKLNDHPELVNDDPYGEGWIIKITLNDSTEIAKLLTAQKYKALIG